MYSHVWLVAIQRKSYAQCRVFPMQKTMIPLVNKEFFLPNSHGYALTASKFGGKPKTIIIT